MKISYGILITSGNMLFLAHVTGQTQWDIPKGCADEGEAPRAAALRETFEETGLRLHDYPLEEIGELPYLPGKRLHLFRARVLKDFVDLAACRCTSFFERDGKLLPEVDAFKWVAFDQVPQHCSKNMGKVLANQLLAPLGE